MARVSSAKRAEILDRVREQLDLLSCGFGPGYTPDEAMVMLECIKSEVDRVYPKVNAARIRGDWTEPRASKKPEDSSRQ